MCRLTASYRLNQSVNLRTPQSTWMDLPHKPFTIHTSLRRPFTVYNHSAYAPPSVHNHSETAKQSLQAQEQLQQLRVVGRAQARDRIPALHGMETTGAAVGVGSVRDVVEGPRVLVQRGLDESHGTFAVGRTFLVDLCIEIRSAAEDGKMKEKRDGCIYQSDHRRPDGRRETGAEPVAERLLHSGKQICTVGGDIRVASADLVVYAAVDANVGGVRVDGVGFVAGACVSAAITFSTGIARHTSRAR